MKLAGYYIALLALTLGLTASADMTQPDHYLMSPNATSLGEYGAVPVSLFTGIPEISIPITEVSAGSHTLPISLSYHGGGVRPDQHPGWVGLGWTLNAGGCVSRIVNGIPDETFYYNVNENTPQYSDIHAQRVRKFGYFYYGKGGVNPGNDQYPIEDTTNEGYKSENETEPDQFTFNVPGLQGSFYYWVGENKWIVQSDRAVRIVFDVNDEQNYWSGVFDGRFDTNESMFKFTRSKVINNFKIIDEYGNTYFFGGNKDAVEYSVGFFSQRSEQPAATTWHLTKIEYADGHTINFSYQKKNFVAQLGVSEFLYSLTTEQDGTLRAEYYNGECISMNAGNINHNDNTPLLNSNPTINQSRGYVQGSLVSPSYLKEISSDNNWKVDFGIEESHELPYYLDELCDMHYQNKPTVREEFTYPCNFNPDGSLHYSTSKPFDNIKFYKLTSVKVSDSKGEVVGSHSLIYNDTDTVENPRLALMELVDEKSEKRYSFEYESLNALPRFCTYNIDHWGFYADTGITRDDNKYKIGEHPQIHRVVDLTDSGYERSRNPSHSLSKYGSLVKIKYPTGGYTRLVYEPNSYHQTVDSTHTKVINLGTERWGGGIRIKEIVQSHSGKTEDEITSKHYVYNNFMTDKSNVTSGILVRPWRYMISLGFSDLAPVGTPLFSFNCNLWTSGNINPISQYTESACVIYSKVTEFNNDDSFTVYTFSNHDNGYPDERQPNGGEISGNYVGLRINIPYYSNAPSRGQILEKSSYRTDKILSRKDMMTYKKSGVFIPVKEFRSYLIPIVKTYAWDSRYQGFSQITKMHDYQIPTYTMRPDSVTTTEYLDGKPTVEQTVTTTYHRGNLPKKETVSLSSGEKTRTEYTYLDDLEDSDAGEILRTSNKVGILRSKKNYLIDSSNKSYLADFVRFGYKDSSPVYPDTIIAGYGDPGIFETTRHKFDSRYNITEIESDGAAPVVFVWGYNRSYPVAKIVNARIADAEAVIGNIEQFSLTPEPNFAKLESLRAALPSASVWIYRFKPLVGLVEVTDPSGNAVKYSYDKAGRLSGIKDVDGHFTDVFDYNYAR